MGSPNGNSKKGMRRDFKCKHCGHKRYAVMWALNNHEPACKLRLDAIDGGNR